jgi:two-component system, OmpR family, phosphate regulon response regulator PhoB
MDDFARDKPVVLCVEDDPMMAMLIAYNLEKSGFSAVTVDDGQSALRVIERVKPQLVILDWTIPSLSGLQVLKRIRNTVVLDGLPILMVTGRAEQEDRKLALQHGATAFFAKPFVLSELMNAVRCNARLPDRFEGAAS